MVKLGTMTLMTCSDVTWLRQPVTLMTLNGAVMLLFVDLYVLICYILYKEFEYLGRTFEMKIAPNGAFNDDLARVRFNYLQRYSPYDPHACTLSSEKATRDNLGFGAGLC